MPKTGQHLQFLLHDTAGLIIHFIYCRLMFIIVPIKISLQRNVKALKIIDCVLGVRLWPTPKSDLLYPPPA
jgi:hypothetical protein